jgi:hypothetical protein
MIYYAEEREDGFAVKGRGNQKASKAHLTENQANRLAHHLAGDEGYVEWRGPDGRFECKCPQCRENRN